MLEGISSFLSREKDATLFTFDIINPRTAGGLSHLHTAGGRMTAPPPQRTRKLRKIATSDKRRWIGRGKFYKKYLDHFLIRSNLRLQGAGLCSTHESWVKFDSTLTQLSRVRVESAVKIQDMSRVRVESRWLSFESELSQLDTAWVKVKSLIFRRENVKILQLSVTLQRKNQPTATFDHSPPPPVNNFFPN